MKTHTNSFKNGIKEFGKEIDSKITYTINNEEVELGAEDLNSITSHYEGSILKSVMRQLDIDSNVEIPLETVINYQFGLKVGNEYEYLNFGNYVVYNVEKQEDTNSYKITCYDKMLYSMIPYEVLPITYPITIRNYIIAICTKLGLTFKNASDTFANYDKIIENELYVNTDGKDIGYTFRDVFDELAEVTGSTICINEEDDELEIRYVNETNDTIDEEYLKDINVNFGEKYGPINSIVLSRGAEGDNIYLRDEESVSLNGLCEIKIKENQILKGNNRDEFLQDLLDALDGLEYYINDYSSPGIVYYNVCDMYNVSIGENTYNCLMLNDELNVTRGLEENIYAEMPKETETDYTKADKTDIRMNQTTLIVDKHEQEIQALASKVVDISSIVEGTGEIDLDNAFEGELYSLEIRGNISLVFPNDSTKYGEAVIISDNLIVNDNQYISSGIPYVNKDTLYPINLLYPKDTYLQVDDTLYKLDFDYLNYINETTYDKYILRDGEQWIERNVGIDENGNLYALENTIIEKKPDLIINVKSNSHIKLLSFANAILKSEYLLNNKYTDTFATQAYVKSEIKVATDEINAEVSAKVDEDEIIAKLNLGIRNGQGVVELVGNTVTIESDDFKLDETGKIEATAGDIAGFEIDSDNGFVREIYAPYDYTQDDLQRIYNIINGSISPTQEDYEKYDIDGDGTISYTDYINVYWYIREGITTTSPGKFAILSPTNRRRLFATQMGYFDGYGNIINGFGHNRAYFNRIEVKDKNTSCIANISPDAIVINDGITDTINMSGETGNITCVSLTQTSLEENKKNFEKYEDSAIDEVKKIDIYKYNLKNENDDDKKHIGFVIGKDYNYSQEITSQENNGVDNYAFTSLLCKAIQEQQEQIEELKKEIKLLKEEQ